VSGRPRHGFTLIELVTVTVILGILSLVSAGPVLIYMSTVRGGAAAARISSDIRYMQRMALSSGWRTWVVFSTVSNTYRLYMENPASPGKAGRQGVTHPMEQTTGAIALNSGPFAGITISTASIGGGMEIEFDNLGAPYDVSEVALSSSGSITLSSGNSVTIQPVSGYTEAQ
jgi:prepilin-type N-terminal cleavage/methylation domain-containing protein